jgi:antitoxin component of MazEF toxin-antitoxin module
MQRSKAMLTKVISALGNSSCIPLDQATAKLLGVEKGSVVKITFEGAKMIVEKLSEVEHKDMIKTSGRKNMQDHSKLMKRLAK